MSDCIISFILIICIFEVPFSKIASLLIIDLDSRSLSVVGRSMAKRILINSA